MNEISQDIINKLRALKPRFKEMNIKRMRVLGSVARREATEDSDVDVLVDFYKVPGWEYISLMNDLSDKIGRKVDMTTEAGLHSALKDSILQDATDV